VLPAKENDVNNSNELKRPVVLRREELYEKVWQTPMNRLAGQYGISGNGLAKICRRLEIPYPPRGYWARKAAGKHVIKYVLLEASEGTDPSVTIQPTPPKAKEPDLPPEIQAQSEAARAAAESITVPERLTRPHPIIEQWLAEHERRKDEVRRERDPMLRRLRTPREFSPLDRRKHRVLDALFKALEQQGAKVKEDERGTLFAEMKGEKVEFQIREKQKQVRRPLTKEEKRFSYRADKAWTQELQNTGRLVFAIKTYVPGIKTPEWRETEHRSMEAMLPDIVATLVAAGPLLVQQRKEREAAERERRAAELKRHEEEQRQKRDDKRWRRFIRLARQSEEIVLARAFLESIKQRGLSDEQVVGGQPLQDWVVWAEAHLKGEDPLNYGADGVFGSIAKVTEWTTIE
jgi:hypothetical protein